MLNLLNKGVFSADKAKSMSINSNDANISKLPKENIKQYKKELKSVLLKIKTTAKRGNFHMYIEHNLRYETVVRLMELGYKVHKKPSCEVVITHIYFIIEW